MIVSVIIPTYCRAPLLCEAVESVLRQDVDGCEVIIIDDGSTDDTRDRILDFGDRVRYFYQENQGLSVARNKGLSIARGDYLAFLDDDDWWMPGKLSLQLQVLERLPDIAGIFTNFSIHRGVGDITTDGMRTWYDSPIDWREVTDRKLRASELCLESELVGPNTPLHIGSLYGPSLDRYYVLPSTAVVRRSLIPKGLQFPRHDPICGDWEFFARLSKHPPLCFIDCDTTYNRSHSHDHRLTQTNDIRQMELRLDFLERVYRADIEFYATNKRKVDDVWKERLAQLCKLQLLDLDRPAARNTSAKLRSLSGSLTASQRAIVAACQLPGSGRLMRGMRTIKRLL